MLTSERFNQTARTMVKVLFDKPENKYHDEPMTKKANFGRLSAQTLFAWPSVLLILDEIHAYRNYTDGFWMARMLALQSALTIGMSATPAPNSAKVSHR
jgi:hypothetical protein